MNDPHPTVGLDDVVHQRTRLGILALLDSGASMEFGALRDALHLTDGNLNRHLKVLQEAELVATERRGSGRPRTWASITATGRSALAAELAALRALIAAAEQ
ncbi:helix-turn-helix domain-containing protein [Rhodococcus triatomae]|uniref:Winged helix DNA-binding domain-containing protein n=1 Tax=Rhodococcus triatomae TaxID=300028 RepID=A0A1G8B6R7_9NOCA|nr:transcriptional regulator [Rhodococcus triatomae]QNG17578.1 helix-turn-helix domain-containing protein [Rhodococcus triatomae]QNG22754.1 helix-turn-helix domain-containing protein [Rhodococcus triatomae]SDH28330.1 Winged helix DNA-binding domain-containing protein [Rhodococcus triatomae]